MSTMVPQITSLTTVYSTVYSGADQRKHQSSASLAFVRGIHRSSVDSPHKGPVTRKMFPFDDVIMPLQLHRNGRNDVSNHLRLDCLLNRLCRSRSKKASKPRVTGLCEGNLPVTDAFPAQRVSNAENVSIWWHHHAPSLPRGHKLSQQRSKQCKLGLW